ncbi:uncharacterized protein DNG_07132 [Cephalotrichum gorgonifer]|uniref:DUF676 domain-containing protein n=1 Tax=Cephalotrichum gorgonifer TaxID=2041049 RepID=A0AAE8N1W8_9PEZI|nr:uncharacterized protein DNG_07132 [Cephalotrichum gorgonifer]
MDRARTIFFGYQVGGCSTINYSYTDSPWRLFAWDIYHFFRLVWSLPWMVIPIRPQDSGAFSELAPTPENIRCLAVVVGTTVFVAVNRAFCLLLNKGCTRLYTSDMKYAMPLPEHAHEEWIFVNGMAVGEHWLQNNLNRLALTFGRPVIGIHNKTNGIVFDIIECLVQRNLNYATCDTRACYRIVKQKLYDPKLSKVILILHSQGGVEGGLVVDWILQELPLDLLSKLEVYTFGNAANHFNNPHRHAVSQQLAQLNPTRAIETVTRTIPQSSPVSTTTSGESSRPPYRDGRRHSLTSISTKTHPAVQDRAISHVEHYAHTTDFAALWGVLHFATSPLASQTVPRFIGRLFIRASNSGGHQFCQHYLDGMFPLERNPETGEFVGAAEDNEFMESAVHVGVEGDASRHVREAFDISWRGSNGFGSGVVVGDVDVHQDGDQVSRPLDGSVVRVKYLSRLWQYRNGRVPHDVSPLLTSGQLGSMR